VRVQLWKCERCSLTFVADKLPGSCPACLHRYSGSTVIRLAGRDVEVESVKLYGENPLKDQSLTRGLESLDLGIRCPHGWIAPLLCRDCQ
jgi:hypothetical protein